MQDARGKIQDARYKMQDARSKRQEARKKFEIQNAKKKKFRIANFLSRLTLYEGWVGAIGAYALRLTDTGCR